MPASPHVPTPRHRPRRRRPRRSISAGTWIERASSVEVPVRDNSRTIAVTLAGAVIGGVAGYLFFTEPGRRFRRSLEPALEDIARGLSSFRVTLQKAAGVAGEGWRLLNEAVGEPGMPPPRRYPGGHQTSPF